MIRNDDPSTSLYRLIEEMNIRGLTSLEYDWDERYVNIPVVDGRPLTEFSSLCSDVCITDEYTRPDDFTGFTLNVDGTLRWTEL